MDNETLKAIAVAVLENVEGDGHWMKDGDKFEKTETPLVGVEEGDIVFFYDEDECAIEQRKVLAVLDGVGYCLHESPWRGPVLMPIEDGVFGRTQDEVIESVRDVIESDIVYHRNRLNTLQAIRCNTP